MVLVAHMSGLGGSLQGLEREYDRLLAEFDAFRRRAGAGGASSGSAPDKKGS